MKTIKFWFPNLENSNLNMHTFDFLKNKFKFVYDSVAPDYLLAPFNYCINKNIFFAFINMLKKNPNAITIGHTTEAFYPDLNLFDYAICFDKNHKIEDRILTMPLLKSFYNSNIENYNKYREISENFLKSPKKFCNFIYSNPIAHPKRDCLFYLINKYKKVDSLGRHLNNCHTTSSRTQKNWFELSVDIKAQYKFSISSENGIFPYYTTEKLSSSYLAKTIPIYWGNEHIEKIINPKAIINANKLSDNELLQTIKEIDLSPSIVKQIISEPLFLENQSNSHLKDLEMFYKSYEHIFSQNKFDAKRVQNQKTFLNQYKHLFY